MLESKQPGDQQFQALSEGLGYNKIMFELGQLTWHARVFLQLPSLTTCVERLPTEMKR